MRKAFAQLMAADIQLVNSSQGSHAKGKIMFSESAQKLSINKNMTMQEGIAIAENGINVSHYYVKFIPRNDTDYAKLKADSTLIIYPFPLDTETSEYSGSYRDPLVPNGIPTYQYASVPVNYKFPDVPYQIIEELFIPNEQTNTLVTARASGGSSFSVSARIMTEQSICGVNQEPITVMEDELEPIDDCGTGGGGGGGSYPPNDPFRNGEDWRPHGRLTVFDEVKNQTIGVEGIIVRARRWFTTYTGISDANGYYAVDGWYTRPANYWLDFERYDFSINDHGGGPREISGPKIEVAWDVNFEGYDKFCSTMFRAAFHYYYKDIQGLRRPPQNSFWATQMKLGAYYSENDEANGNHAPIRRLFGIGEAIHIYNPSRRIDDIYATTIHELGHAVHWDMGSSDYHNSDDNVSETWSNGVQWVLTKAEYPNYRGRPNGTLKYTNFIMDLIDSPSQEYSGYGTFAPIDQVQGYNIVQIQNALTNVRKLVDWKNNIKDIYDNNTENNLDALYNYWVNH